MAGNAAEWVQDTFNPAAYWTMRYDNPVNETKGAAHVYRGGSYVSADAELMTTARGNAADPSLKKGCQPGSNTPVIGFRCVKDVVR
jgi:formylglycine-generating enzyme required for sulfatase activity